MFDGLGRLARQTPTKPHAITDAGVYTSPTLDLDFTTGVLDPRVTFTRAITGPATYYDSNGVLRTAANNNVTNSGPLTNFSTTASTKTANAILAPDGTTTGAQITEDVSVASDHAIDFTLTPAGSTVYTFSCYLRAGTRRYAAVELRSGANWTTGNTFVIIDLQTGAITANAAGLGVVQNVGGGWYRASITGTTIASPGVTTFRVGLSADGTNIAYTGDGASYSYFWGAQIETGPVMTQYVATGAAANGAPRFDYDPVARTPRGLLIEETRTNQCFPSIPDNTGWTTTNGITTLNQTIAPDGTNAATLFIDNNTSNAHQNVTNGSFAYVAGTAYTFSIYAKAATANGLQIFAGAAPWDAATYANFDLNAGVVGTRNGNAASSSIQAVGNGWYRCSFTTTALSSASTVYFAICLTNNNNSAGRGTIYVGTGTGVYIWGAQTEAGAFPTSYIPTSGAAATRPAETATMTNTGWFNAASGTFSVDFLDESSVSTPNSRSLICDSDGTTNNRVQLFLVAAPSAVAARVVSGGVSSGLANLEIRNVGVVNKAAVSYDATAARARLNNGVMLSAAGNFVPVSFSDGLYIGGQNVSIGTNAVASCWFRRLRYWKTALPIEQFLQVTL